jgi:hypothetical protein
MLTSSQTAKTAVEEVIMRSSDVDEVLAGLAPGGRAQPHIRGFVEGLLAQGHTLLTSRDYARAAGHFGRWMDACDLSLKHLQNRHVEDFGCHLCACSHAGRRSRSPSKRYVRRVLRFVD